MAQRDMGRRVVETQKEFADIWYVISKLHWDVQLEGLAYCMREYVNPYSFKYLKFSYRNFSYSESYCSGVPNSLSPFINTHPD